MLHLIVYFYRKSEKVTNMEPPSDEQLNLLLEYMEKHENFSTNKLSRVQGNAQNKKEWENLADILDAVGPAKKHVSGWKQVGI